MHPILEHNRKAWNERVRERKRHTRTVTDKELTDPLRAVDPDGWLGGDIRGKRVLCLAAGGGLQSILYAAAGGVVTVVDLSDEMLELDRTIAAERNVQVNAVRASMDDLSTMGDATFDIIIQPVSTCYVPHVSLVYHQVARLQAAGGLYISQHKQPVSLQTAALPLPEGYLISESYYRTEALPEATEGLVHREGGTMEFIHRWSQLQPSGPTRNSRPPLLLRPALREAQGEANGGATDLHRRGASLDPGFGNRMRRTSSWTFSGTRSRTRPGASTSCPQRAGFDKS
jgi:SAM-dependent methyltransferase